MGIENGGGFLGVGSVVVLITPHGDRKLLSTGGGKTVVAGDSLPLMGIENYRRRRLQRVCTTLSLPLMGIENVVAGDGQCGRLSQLITPHGDRKRQRGSRARCRSPPSHYPSWGSKTGPEHRAVDAERYGLITPHGDRKLAPPQTERLHGLTHYPSWGSKTVRALRLCAERDLYSLPLMGIENTGSPTTACWSSSSSLPLMGIENRGHHPPGARRHHGLITPHGDRKRAGEARSQPWRLAHYPSWGSKTPATIRCRLPYRRPHYPSWGSKTPISANGWPLRGTL